jgi:hypothetical protein
MGRRRLVIPAKAEIQSPHVVRPLGPRFRGDDIQPAEPCQNQRALGALPGKNYWKYTGGDRGFETFLVVARKRCRGGFRRALARHRGG